MQMLCITIFFFFFIQQKQISMQMEMHSEVVLGMLEENGDNIHKQGHLKDFELEDL